jgi:ribosomal protein L11 methyltransferase
VTAGRYTRYTLRLAPGDGEPAAGDDLDYRHPEAVALLRGLRVGWQEKEGGDTLVFWLHVGAEREPGPARTIAGLAALGRLEAADEAPGWEDAWKAFHQPQTIGRLYVRPPWSPPHDGLLDLAIEAGMAFGTGGHATTRQCLEELQDVPPGSLLDLGCGSGVVALAAQRLGFAPVWGVDIDPLAVRAARDNAARNDLTPAFSAGDATDPAVALPAADTAVANIALGPILGLAARFAAPPGDGAPPPPRRLLLAGLLTAERDAALAAFPDHDLAASRDDGEWLLLRLEAA